MIGNRRSLYLFAIESTMTSADLQRRLFSGPSFATLATNAPWLFSMPKLSAIWASLSDQDASSRGQLNPAAHLRQQTFTKLMGSRKAYADVAAGPAENRY